MKVQCLNSSARKTRNAIKKAFATLIHEKKELNKITVTELVKKAEITRSTFYTHYDNLDQVAQEYQLQTIELICNDDLKLSTKADIFNYFDTIFACLKENEETYQLLLTADDTIFFLEKLKTIASKKIYAALKTMTNDTYLVLDLSFFMNGMMMEIIQYFRGESAYSLEELLLNIKKWFSKIFS